MSEPPMKKPSSLLAALDNPSFLRQSLGVTPTTPVNSSAATVGMKRALELLEDTPRMPGTRGGGSNSNKRRATGLGAALENVLRLSTPGPSAPLDVPMLSQLVGSQRPRPSPGPSVRTQFALRYDNETEISRIDVGGEDQDLRMAEFVTKTIDNVSHGLTVQNAMDKLNLKDKRDLISGMEVRLLPHQIIGVSWMVDQERISRNKGGILADDMGLGKTVQMIATMAINQPGTDDKYRTTLIVVPAALLLQWKEEIESKTNDIFTVHIQHGKDKLKTVEALEDKDVIITTYQTLNMDFAIPSDVESGDEMNYLINNGGPLARMKWYRVITDEAQFIRNRATRSSKAVAMLRAKYRWCLTGTPVTNTLADIYGLLRFGHFRPWNDWNDFNEYIAKVQMSDAPLAGLRAQEVLRPLLLRRMKNSELEGRPILELPEKHIELVMIEFSVQERELYDAFEKRAQINLNKYIRERTILKNHSAVLVMILRLRQLCGHPGLILSQSEEFEDPTLLVGSEVDKEIARASRVMGAKWVSDIKQEFLERAKRTRADYDDEDVDAEASCPICGDLFMSDNGRLLACGHEICFDCLLDLSNSPIAHDGIFGQADEQTNLRIEKEFETAAAKGLRPCPTCKKMQDLQASHTFKSSAFEPTEEEFRSATRVWRKPSSRPRSNPSSKSCSSLITSLGSMKKPSRSRKEIEELVELSESSDEELPDLSMILKGHGSSPSSSQGKDASKGKGKRRAVVDGDEESDDDILDVTVDKHKNKAAQRKSNANNIFGGGITQPRQELVATWRRGDDTLEPSSKMMALVGYLKEWAATGDKTIVYSQWTSMLDLVETLFSRYGIRSLRYDGKMNRESREAVLALFRKTGGPKVILISTKCGGVGLNLVSANRIVNLDLSWNYASESQAYDRVHRLGQEKEVFVKRVVVKDTIEDRMLQLQETKTGLAEAALGEGGGVKLHKLSVKELRALFGMKNNNDPPAGQTQLV